MTPRIPLWKCRRCSHFNDIFGCHLADLEPCNFKYDSDERAKDIFLLLVTIVGILAIVWLLFCGTPKEEPIEHPKTSAMELLHMSNNSLSEWDKLILAIAFTESRFNPTARGAHEDTGILQITPIYVKEINRLHGTDYTINDAFDIKKSIEMYELMQAYYNPTKDKELAIYLHNKGENYKKAVLNNLAIIENYEQIRKAL